MNFEHMPELTWYYGYFLALGLMATVAIGMIVFFRLRRWF
jgi:magnesium transporter